MRDLNIMLHIMWSCALQALRHPRTPICHCSDPIPVVQSPIPWWAATVILMLGVGTWVVSARLSVPEMGEAARLMVYGPISYMFGMSHQISMMRKQQQNQGGQS